MSVTVKQASIATRVDATADSPHVFRSVCIVAVKVVKADVAIDLVFSILPGFKTDGASIPKPFQWFLPSWDKSNDLYNIAATIHDGLYIHKGFGLFSREECDDILRGVWRESGISRFKAGVADKCVEWFAGGNGHWGNDSYKVGELFTMEF